MEYLVKLLTDVLVIVGGGVGVSVLTLALFFFIVTSRADKEG